MLFVSSFCVKTLRNRNIVFVSSFCVWVCTQNVFSVWNYSLEGLLCFPLGPLRSLRAWHGPWWLYNALQRSLCFPLGIMSSLRAFQGPGWPYKAFQASFLLKWGYLEGNLFPFARPPWGCCCKPFLAQVDHPQPKFVSIHHGCRACFGAHVW